MKSFVARSRWAAIGAAIAVSFGGGAVFVANAIGQAADTFVAVEPCRLLDTRLAPENVGVRVGRIGPVPDGEGSQLTHNEITVYFDSSALNLGRCDLDEDAGDLLAIRPGDVPVALVVNLTALNASTATYVTVYPWVQLEGTLTEDAENRPFVSHVNPWPGHHPMTNTITVGLNPDTDNGNLRALRVHNHVGRVDVILDVVGYYTA